MNLVNLGRKGQLSIPRAILQGLHHEGDQMLIVETSPDGARGAGPVAAVMANVARVPKASVVPVADVGAELPAQDRPILAAAIACGADLRVTGHRRHSGPLFGAAVGRTAVAPPRAALGVLLETIES